jgi:catechol 2,3-dioxygenase-like lactoylglutathione lyase family enzyme
MFDHVKFGVSDYAASKAFFLKALAPFGVGVVSEGAPTHGVELSPRGGKVSLCLYQNEEKPAPLHLAFVAENRDQVDAFYRAAMEAGWQRQWCAWSVPGIPCELLCSFRHWSGRAQHRSGLSRTLGEDMKRIWTIIGVRDVPASFKWYQSLFGQPETPPGHECWGQILDTDGTVLLCLHQWSAHDHPSLMSPDDGKAGNGLLLFFRVDDYEMALKRHALSSAGSKKSPT